MTRFRQIVSKKVLMRLLLGLLLVQVISLLGLGLSWPRQPAEVPLAMVVPQAEMPYWQTLVDAFEAENANIHIELTTGSYTPEQIEAIYSADLQTSTPRYDLVYLDVTWLPGFASRGWLQDLTPQITAAALSEFLGSEVEMSRYQKQLYRLPFRADIGVMLVNQQLVAPVNLPTTFAALLQVSRSLRQQRHWGYLWQGRADESLVANFVEVLDGFGGFWIDPATQSVGLNQPEAIRAIQFLRNTLVLEASPPTVIGYEEQTSFTQFQLGNTAFLRIWPQFWQQANAANSPLHNQVGLSATLALPGRVRRACRGGWGLAIAQKTAHPEAAWQAVDFFTSAAAQRQFSLASGYLPSRKALFADAQLLAAYPHFRQLLEQLQTRSVFRPQIPEYEQASEILQTQLWRVLVGDVSPEIAMQQAAEQTRSLLKHGVAYQRFE
ncbi:extracellular solute-binding protein [Almyronema epifaneia]|uniref:Extracellular solute-binding protein n=1 Tax=Almyronema epifaneia S1 TaxID=2991925 RepID=A0ABW6IJ49_9CYAN